MLSPLPVGRIESELPTKKSGHLHIKAQDIFWLIVQQYCSTHASKLIRNVQLVYSKIEGMYSRKLERDRLLFTWVESTKEIARYFGVKSRKR